MTDSRLPAPVPGSVRDLLRTENVKARFQEVLKDRAPQFIASLANLIYATPALRDCEPHSVIAASMIAASLDLPIDKNLGFAYVIPYLDNRKHERAAQFQMGYKGYIQLALRTGRYRTLHCTEVYAGEIKGVNRFTGQIEFGEKTSDDVVGYLAYLKLVNGFEKTVYMTVAEIRAHAGRYSKNYGSETGLWQTNFHVMALKTVMRQLLMKWGMLSIELRDAITQELPPDEPGADGAATESDPDQRQSDKESLWGSAESAGAPPGAPPVKPAAPTNGNGLALQQQLTALAKPSEAAALLESTPGHKLYPLVVQRFKIDASTAGDIARESHGDWAIALAGLDQHVF